jgi:general secretion pathway protein I
MKQCRQHRRDSRGFTLLEILIALAVLALAMGAVIKATSDYTGNHAHLHARTMATWVARNVMIEFQVTDEWPKVGERKGSREMGNQEWRWVARISQTDEAELRRLDVDVMLADSDSNVPVTTLSGFLQQQEGS